jgi:integrase
MATATATTALRVLEPDPVEAFVVGWLDAYTASAQTWRAYFATLESFAAALGEHGLRLGSDPGLVAAIAQRWARQRHDGRPGEASAATQNRRLAILSSFYHYAARMASPADIVNPIAKVKRAKVQAYRGARALHDGDVRRHLAAIDRTTPAGQRDYALLLLGLQTGRRRAELAALTWADVELVGASASVVFRHCKGDKELRDDLPPAVTASLLTWLATSRGVATPAEMLPATQNEPIWVSLSHNGSAGHQLTGQALADICKKRLGTSRVHALRHSFATQMEQIGALVSEIRDRLGHASLDTTTRYLSSLGAGTNRHAEALAARWLTT